MSQFQALLADLDAMHQDAAAEDLTKSAPADAEGAGDDAAIEDAAAEGEDAGEAEDAGDAGEAGEGESDEGETEFGKSLALTDENGDPVDAIDATDLIKSLIDKVEGLGSLEGNVVKALTGITDLVKSQAATISTLSSKVAQLGSAGIGRKTVVTVAPKADAEMLAKSETAEPAGVKPTEFMAKAMEALEAGKITGLQVSIAEGHLNRGTPIPEAIVSRVLG